MEATSLRRTLGLWSLRGYVARQAQQFAERLPPKIDERTNKGATRRKSAPSIIGAWAPAVLTVSLSTGEMLLGPIPLHGELYSFSVATTANYENVLIATLSVATTLLALSFPLAVSLASLLLGAKAPDSPRLPPIFEASGGRGLVHALAGLGISAIVQLGVAAHLSLGSKLVLQLTTLLVAAWTILLLLTVLLRVRRLADRSARDQVVLDHLVRLAWPEEVLVAAAQNAFKFGNNLTPNSFAPYVQLVPNLWSRREVSDPYDRCLSDFRLLYVVMAAWLYRFRTRHSENQRGTVIVAVPLFSQGAGVVVEGSDASPLSRTESWLVRRAFAYGKSPTVRAAFSDFLREDAEAFVSHSEAQQLTSSDHDLGYPRFPGRVS